MHDKIFEIVLGEDEITWKSLLYDLVKAEGMDPWNIDISLLTKQFIEMIKTMKKMDLRISGKVLLASALLLKFKSNYLLTEEMNNFDALVASSEQQEEEMWEEVDGKLVKITPERLKDYKNAVLIPRTPQPRKRKVSIYDLVDALQQALEVNKRRVERYEREEMEAPKAPEKKIDISKLMNDMLSEIYSHFEDALNQKLTFTRLCPDESKECKVLTFIPLLHLTNARKIDLEQEEHFGEIEIMLQKAVEEGVEKEESEA